MAVANAISEWKNKAIELVLGQDEIMELLEMDDNEADDPVYTRIFPYNHIPQTIEETKVYITFTVNIPRITFNKIWAYPRLTVRVIAHQERMKLNMAGVSATRIDYIAKLIVDLLTKNDFGFGKLQLATNYEDLYNFIFHYRELVFVGEELIDNYCDTEE